jgi:hypothetical protein
MGVYAESRIFKYNFCDIEERLAKKTPTCLKNNQQILWFIKSYSSAYSNEPLWRNWLARSAVIDALFV